MGRKKKQVEEIHPYSMKATRGKPAYFKTPEQMNDKMEDYFEWIKGERVNEMRMVRDEVSGTEELKQVTYWKREPEKSTITGLCLFLGFHSLQAFDRYEEKDEKYVRVIARGKLLVQKRYEEATQDRNSARGAIYVLGNLGWSNRTEVQTLGKDGKPVDPAAPMVVMTGIMPNTKKEI